MSKLKYYQLAHKDGNFEKLVSPGSFIVEEMILDGYNFFGYDNEADIPVNPIIDNDIVREMTEQEIADKEAVELIEWQNCKSTNLKLADNYYLSIIASIPEAAGITPATKTIDIADKLEAAIVAETLTEIEAVKIGLKLQAAIGEIQRQGGSWFDLPNQLHVI